MPYKDKSKQLSYQNLWMKRRRLEWVMSNGPCKKCGLWDDLEVDHVDVEYKKIPTRLLWSMKEEKRIIELSKTQILCKECHKEKSNKEKKFNFNPKQKRDKKGKWI